VTPNNFLGRVLAYDIGFLLNISQTTVFLLYGPVLYDKLHLDPFYIAIVQAATAAVTATLWIIWFIVTKDVEHKLVPVDKRGNDIVKRVENGTVEFSTQT
jgi:hypothetical protein